MQDWSLRLLLSSLFNGYLEIIHNKGIKKYECLVGTSCHLYIVRRISENTKNKKECLEETGRGVAFLDRIKNEVFSFVLISTNFQIYEISFSLMLET